MAAVHSRKSRTAATRNRSSTRHSNGCLRSGLSTLDLDRMRITITTSIARRAGRSTHTRNLVFTAIGATRLDDKRALSTLITYSLGNDVTTHPHHPPWWRVYLAWLPSVCSSKNFWVEGGKRFRVGRWVLGQQLGLEARTMVRGLGREGEGKGGGNTEDGRCCLYYHVFLDSRPGGEEGRPGPGWRLVFVVSPRKGKEGSGPSRGQQAFWRAVGFPIIGVRGGKGKPASLLGSGFSWE